MGEGIKLCFPHRTNAVTLKDSEGVRSDEGITMQMQIYKTSDAMEAKRKPTEYGYIV